MEEKEVFRPQKGTCIVDIHSNVRYEISTGLVLGQGAYGVVYEVERLPAPGDSTAFAHPKDLAVLKLGKVLREHQENDEALRERLQTLQEVFEREEENIRLIRARSGERFAPWAASAAPISQPSATVPPLLLMQKISEDWRLQTQLSEAGPHEKERLAASTGMQYAELLMILHDDLGFTCVDRKPTDVHWDPGEHKLYLLDWNVTQSRGPDEKWDEVRQKAISTFGSLWCELLGIDVSEDLELRAESEAGDPAPAGQVSQAMRRLLLRTMDSTGGRGFAGATELHAAWETHLNWLQHPSSALSVARSLMDDPGTQWRERWETVSDAIELLERYGKGQFESELGELRTWASNSAQIQDESFKNVLASPKRNINNGFYEQALQALAKIRQDVQWTARNRLTASRWYLAAQALEAWSSLYSSTQQEIVPILRTLVDELDRHEKQEGLATHPLEKALQAHSEAEQKADDLAPVAADWTEPKASSGSVYQSNQGSAPLAQPDLPAQNRVKQILAVFDWELAWWEQLGRAEPSRELSSRLDALKEAQSALDALRDLDPIHASLLVAVAPFPLESAIDELTRKQRRQDSLQGAREREEEILQQISNRLDRALGDKPPAWPVLAALLRERPEGTWLEPLAALDLVLQQGMTKDILDRTSELLPRLGHEPDLRKKIVTLVRSIGNYQVQQWQHRACWSDEIDATLDLVAGLSNPSWSSPGGSFDQFLAEARTRLEVKKQQIFALRHEWRDAGGKGPLDYPQRRELDAILSKAVRQGVEFLADRDDGRSPLAAAEVLQQRKASLHGMQLRGTNEDLNAQLHGLTALVTAVKDARQELRDLGTQLGTQNQRLDEMLKGLQNRLGAVVSLSQSSTASGVAVNYDQVEALRTQTGALVASGSSFGRQGEQEDLSQPEIDPLTDSKRTADLLKALEGGAEAGPDQLGRTDMQEKLDALLLQRNLSHKEHLRIQELGYWQKWASQYLRLAPTWRRPGPTDQGERVEKLIDSVDQLLQAAPRNLPRWYWQEISGVLRKVYDELEVSSDDGSELSPEQLVQVGLFSYRVAARLSTEKDSA